MSYSSKTFKVNPMYQMLYQSCIDVLEHDKSPLLMALLEKEIGRERANELELYDFNELFEKMLFELKKETYEASYDDVVFFVQHHDRIIKIRNLFLTKNAPSNNIILSFRVPDFIVEEVHKLKRNTLGEVVDLSIGLFVCRCEELVFNLILLSFEMNKKVPSK